MKRMISLIALVLGIGAFSFLNAQNTTVLRFTGQGVNGTYVQLGSVEVQNLTRGWEETIVYPDTILMLGNVGIEDHVSITRFALSQNVPNPFRGSTDFSLQLPEADRVSISVMDLNGKKITDLTQELPAGIHIFRVILNTPQTYLVTAKTDQHSATIKIINQGSEFTNRIEYRGMGPGHITYEMGVNKSTFSDHDFQPGDLMRYVGKYIADDVEYSSDTILQPQFESQDFTLLFPCVPLNVTMFNATTCNTFTWNDQTYTQSGTYTQTFQAANGCDSVVTLNLTVNQPVTNSISETVCGSYVWNGQTYTQSGTYTQTFQAANGCDSVVTLNLTVNQPVTNSIAETVCGGYVWNGQTYTQSGVYTQTFQAANGCDSVVTLTLTVNQPVTNSISETVCGGYVWNGQTYVQSGTYTQTFQAANGCDSVVTLNLTVNQPVTNSISETVCGGHVWNGQTYTQSGSYSQTFTAANGCDSVVTLTLTVNQPVTNSISETVCGGHVWNGQTYTQSGTYSQTFTAANGCDSVVTLTLTVNQPVANSIAETVCENYEWNGQTYTQSGSYTQTFTAANGCDSVVTLTLTVNQPVANSIAETVCENYEWNGQTYTQSGSYTQTFTAANGCDSVVTLTLTVNQPVTNSISETVCGGHVWNGQTYTQSGTYTQTFTAANGCDSVVTLTLTVNQPVTNSIAETVCGGYVWNGQTYTQSGTYTQTFTAANGCDSVVTLNLTVNQPVANSISETICGGYVWNGQTYTQSGTYTQTFQAANGCDSVVTLTLTVNQPVANSISETVCGGHVWNGQTYTQSGTYTQTFTAANGCDSVVTLNLTVNQPVAISIAETVCESYEWNGQTYTQSGTYTQIFQAANGCDSVVTLNLTVNQPVSNSISETVCGGYVWNGQTYTQSGTYTQTFTAANGCDSVVTLNLTVNQPVANSIAETVCSGYVWNGQTYTQSGIYTQTFQAANGCDSVVTLTLTVNQPVANSISETVCESYEWNNQTYTQSGTYTQTFQAANGCDSVVTLNLMVNQSVTNSISETVCGGHVWNGQTYVQSGTYTQTFQAANGCDSVVTLNLTVNQPVTNSIAETVCGGYEWNGQTYTQSGSYTQTFTAANGCDSVVTLTLTVNQPVTNSIAETVCESYDWNGQTYTQSGSYTQTFTAANGCDSVVTLTLTVNQPVTNSIAETVCENYEWNGQTYTQSGTYTQTFQAANGCDSVVTLNLTVNQPVTDSISETVCGGYVWNGQTYTQSGSYTQPFTAANGCDSVVTLNLTVNQPVTNSISDTVNGSYEWNGQTYTESGTYTQTFTAANGCDSVVTLTLTVNNFVCGLSTVADHEGNEYHTISIGSQCWTKENLRTTTSPSTGTHLIPAPGTSLSFTGKQAFWYDNDSATYAPQNYGLLYNWNAAVDTFNTAYGETSVDTSISHSFPVTFSGHRRGICPEGWHLPTDTEWNVLTSYLSSQSQYVCGNYSNSIAKALASTTGWDISYWDCTPGSSSYLNNASGFSAFPAGCSFMDSPYYLDWETGELIYNDTLRFFEGLSERAFFWSASSSYSEDARCFLVSSYDYEAYNEYASKTYGASVRCVYDADTCSSVSFPTVTTSSVSVLSDSTAMCGGEVLSDGGAPVIARGVCWNTSQNPTVSDNHTTDGDGMGSFASNVTGLSGDRTFYVRAYATNAVGTAYGEEVSFRTVPYPEVQPCPGIPTVTDYDGNVYNTVQIGDQCWMRENLRTTHYADGTVLQEGSFTPFSGGPSLGDPVSLTPLYYHVNANNDSDSLYGLFYNWLAVMNGAGDSEDSLSEVQGVCPNGWHVPSDEEWGQLLGYASSQSIYWCGDDSLSVAKAFATTSGWNSCANSCAVGNRPQDNNALGFSALPIGNVYRIDNTFGNYFDFGNGAFFWSTTGHDDWSAGNCSFYHCNANILQGGASKSNGLSVRCLRNNKPTVTTASVTSITDSSAVCGGNVTDEGFAAVTARGICLSTSPNPTLDDNHTTDGNGTGEFTITIIGLNSGTTYYVRAYATNSEGTVYGEEVTFTTTGPVVDEKSCPGTLTVTDVEGNIYSTVKIGEQCWMRENLRTMHYEDGTPIPNGGVNWNLSNTDPYYYGYDYSDSIISLVGRGYLYNWSAVMHGVASSSSNPSGVQGICPTGWHLPSDAEWMTLKYYMSSQTEYICGGETNYIAKALASTTGWINDEYGYELCEVGNDKSSNNASGFGAVPAGFYWDYGFRNEGYSAYFWSSTEKQGDSSSAYNYNLHIFDPIVGRYGEYKYYGCSVRCLSNDNSSDTFAILPTVLTDTVSNITNAFATCGGYVISDGNAEVSARGVCWKTSPNPTVNDSHTSDGTGTGEFISTILELSPSTTYYVRAYATNTLGTAYGEEVMFTTTVAMSEGDGQPCPGASTITDYDGNVYSTVKIGDQCWMRENLRTTHYADGAAIFVGSDTSITDPYFYDYDISGIPLEARGYLYNWAAVMNGASASNAVPSGVQGVCPTGWHVPSAAEWSLLTDYVSGQSEYVCNGNGEYIAKALASTTGWNTSEFDCSIGNNQVANNITGFSVVPAGFWNYGLFGSAGYMAVFWLSSEYEYPIGQANVFLYCEGDGMGYGSNHGHNGFSVRCLRDTDNVGDTSTVSYLPFEVLVDTPCTSATTPMPHSAEMLNYCVGTDTVQLSIGNYEYGIVQWQVSTDTVEWTDIENANDTVYVFYPEETAYYRAKMTYNWCSPDYSQTIHLNLIPRADAGRDRVQNAGQYVQLSGNEFEDATGLWTVLVGDSAAIEDPTNPRTMFLGSDSLYVLTWTLTNSCGSSTDTMTIRYVPLQFADHIVVVDTTDLILSDSSSRANGIYHIVFNTPVPTIADSTILVGIPYGGFLRRVVAFIQHGDTALMYTEQATLDDLIEEGAFNFDGNVLMATKGSKSGNGGAPNKAYARLNHQPTRAELSENPDFMDGKVWYYEYPMEYGFSDGSKSLNITGFLINNDSLKFGPGVSFSDFTLTPDFSNADWEFYKYRGERYIYFRTGASFSYSFKMKVKSSFSYGFIQPEKLDAAPGVNVTLTNLTQRFLAFFGPVPVEFSANYEVKCGLTGNVEVTAQQTFNVSGALNLDYELRSENGEIKTNKVPHDEPFVTMTPDNSSISISADVALEFTPKLSLKLYECLGPYFKIGPKLSLKCCRDLISDNVTVKLKFGFPWKAGVEMTAFKKKFLDININDEIKVFEKSDPAYLESFPVSAEDYEVGEGVIHPASFRIVGGVIPLSAIQYNKVRIKSTSGFVSANSSGPFNTSELNLQVLAGDTVNIYWKPGLQYFATISVELRDCEGKHVKESPMCFYVADGESPCLRTNLQLSEVNGQLRASGGRRPYTYATEDLDFTNISISPIPDHTYYVRDANNCVAQYYAPPQDCGFQLNYSLYGDSVLVLVEGGILPHHYTFYVDGYYEASRFRSSPFFHKKLQNGVHTLSVLDETIGCERSFTVTADDGKHPPIVCVNPTYNTYDSVWNEVQSILLDDGNLDITEWGLYYSQSPTMSPAHHIVAPLDAEAGSFMTHIPAAIAQNAYYVCAYAVNERGTAYSDTVLIPAPTIAPLPSGLPCSGTPTVSDYDGNVYNTVKIGNQCWMAENLRTTHFADGELILLGDIYTTDDGYYRFEPGNSANNVAAYGYLYDWRTVMHGAVSSTDNPPIVQGICPTGWHVPSDAEWTELTDFTSSLLQFVCGGDTSYIAKALASTEGWHPYSGTCYVGDNPSDNNATGFAAMPAGFFGGYYDGPGYGAMFWTSTPKSNVEPYSYSIGYAGRDVYRGYDYFWDYAFSVRCLRDEGATAENGLPCPGMPTVTDYDGNVYNTVQFGNQCWTRENMRTTHYADGTAIPAGETGNSETEPYYYDNVSNDILLSERGYLYNWPAVMHGAASSNANSSGAQGVCPTGWHVPSDAEWTQLTNYVSGQMEYICGGNPPQIAKALASETGWGSCSGECFPGDQNIYANNNSGFSAIPAGNYYNGLAPLGYHARFWSSTPDSSDKAYSRHILYNATEVYRNSYNRANGFSVRCLRDEDSSTVQHGQPCPGTPTVTDYDGNVYNTVQIGNQCWTKENLRTTHYADGTAIPTGGNNESDTDPYYYDYSSSNIPLLNRGYLYNWPAVMHGTESSNANQSGVQGVCPVGWHVPSDAEWTQLTDCVSSQAEYICGGNTSYIAKALASIEYWYSGWSGDCYPGDQSVTANNASGFGMVPAGYYNGGYYNFGGNAYYWSATQNDAVSAWFRNLNGSNASVNRSDYYMYSAFSVRCLRNDSSTVQHGQPCPGTPTVTDYDGNVYNTVQIGNQCWTRENLRTTHYSDGTTIPAGGNNYSKTDPYYYDYSSSNIPLSARGYLYNWSAVMYGATSSDANPSGVQGICPTGWHVPSDAEWTQLTDYVSNQTEYICGGNTSYIAKALASTEYWDSFGGDCVPGEQSVYANNATGFSAVPANNCVGSSFGGAGYYALFWSATQDSGNYAYSRNLDYDDAGVDRYNDYKYYGYSVRCLRNEDSSTVGDAQSCPGTPTVTDYDGNVYNTVLIGDQCWTRENLRTTHYADGTLIPAGGFSVTDPYYYDDSSSNIPLSARGYLYNWPAVMHGAASSDANPSGVQGICPTGWHVPSRAEWTQLMNYVSSKTEYICGGNIDNIAKALASTEYWDSYSGECTPGDQSVTSNNASGFGAVPVGMYTLNMGGCHDAGEIARFWTSSSFDSNSYYADHAYYRELYSYYGDLTGSYFYKNRGYSVRCLHDENIPTVGDAQPCPGTPTVTDYDGNVYNAVQIGNQCWTRENMRTTHYTDGTAIPAGGTTTSGTDPYYYDYSSSNIPLSARGYLYNWPAVMHGAASSDANPSGVQGICPTGWHVPSDAEWTTLTDYVGGQSEYVCGGNTSYIAKALASTEYWNSYSGGCAPGDQSVTANNASGFGAVPVGKYDGSYFFDFGGSTFFWSATQYDASHAWLRYLVYGYAYAGRGYNYYKDFGYSVRCLRD